MNSHPKRDHYSVEYTLKGALLGDKMQLCPAFTLEVLQEPQWLGENLVFESLEGESRGFCSMDSGWRYFGIKDYPSGWCERLSMGNPCFPVIVSNSTGALWDRIFI